MRFRCNDCGTIHTQWDECAPPPVTHDVPKERSRNAENQARWRERHREEALAAQRERMRRLRST